MKTCLESSPERPHAPFGGVRTQPRRVSPSDVAVASSYDLLSSNNQLYQPLVGKHLPHHEAPLLLRHSRACNAAVSSWAKVVHHRHLDLPSGKNVLDPSIQLPAARRRRVMLYYVLRRRWNLAEEGRRYVTETNRQTDRHREKERDVSSLASGLMEEVFAWWMVETGKRGQPKTLRRTLRFDFLLKEKRVLIQFRHECCPFFELLMLSSSFMGSSDNGARRLICLFLCCTYQHCFLQERKRGRERCRK